MSFILPRAGNATMVLGTVTVAHTAVTETSVIMLTRKTIIGTTGTLSYTLDAGTSFTINSTNVLDVSVISWALLKSI